VRSKVALLQSKRLYPDELVNINEDAPIDYWRGFGRLFERDDEWADVIAPRPFTFTEQSRYRTLIAGNDQYRAIAGYEQQRQVPVYYMLYNPLGVPSTTVLPLRPNDKPTDACDVGCRVVPASQLRAVTAAEPEGSNPSFGQLAASLTAPFDAVEHRAGWRLEHFVVNLLLDCAGGYIANSPNDGGLNYIFNRRSAPISAALALTLDAP